MGTKIEEVLCEKDCSCVLHRRMGLGGLSSFGPEDVTRWGQRCSKRSMNVLKNANFLFMISILPLAGNVAGPGLKNAKASQSQ